MRNGTLISVSLILILILLFFKKTNWEEDDCRRDYPIDCVITWLDVSDRDWWKRYREEQKRMNPNEVYTHENITPPEEVNHPLHLNVLLHKKNLPWLRNIYIFCQRPQHPNWLPKDEKKKRELNLQNVFVVYHDEIESNEDISSLRSISLPTFNGMVTCSLTSHIPNLSERYIQHDDDIFPLQRLPPSYFFTDDGLPIIRAHPVRFESEFVFLSKKNDGYAHIKENTLKMLFPLSNNDKNFYDCNHNMIPCVKSMVRECKESVSEEQWRGLRPIRSKADFDFYGVYLAPWIVYNRRESIVLRDKLGVFFIEGRDFASKSIPSSTTVLCVNNEFNDDVRKYLEGAL